MILAVTAMKTKLKMLPNLITLSRIFLTFLFVMQQYKQNYNYLVIIFVLICITDVLDGKMSRQLKAESNLGGFLDLAADAFFIFSSFITLNIFNIIPSWYTLFIFFKFIEFIITSSLWKMFNNESREYYMKDTPGRLAAALFYITPGIIYMLFYVSFNNLSVILIPCICITTMLTLCSSFIRCSKILSALKRDTP